MREEKEVIGVLLVTHTKRQKLLNELADLEKLRKLYKKHAVQAIGAIRKCDRRIIRINYLLIQAREMGKGHPEA